MSPIPRTWHLALTLCCSILLTGCGTSEHAAMGVAALLTEALDLPGGQVGPGRTPPRPGGRRVPWPPSGAASR